MSEQEHQLSIVSILSGSEADVDVMSKVAGTLDSFDVRYEVADLGENITDAAIAEYFDGLSEGVEVHIVAGGVFPSLPNRIKKGTKTPVIGLPISASPLEGLAILNALSHDVQLPSATFVGLNNHENAALLAVQILAVSDSELAKRYKEYRDEFPSKVARQNEWLQSQ